MKFTTIDKPVKFNTTQAAQLNKLVPDLSMVCPTQIFIPSICLDGKTPKEGVLFVQFIVPDESFEKAMDVIDNWEAEADAFSASVIPKSMQDDMEEGVCFAMRTID